MADDWNRKDSLMATVTVPTTSTGTGTGTLTITKPSGLAVGDGMVAQIYAFLNAASGGAVPSFNTPTGWTIVSTAQTDSTLNQGQCVFAKVADSADVAATNFTFTVTGSSGTPVTRGAIIRTSGNDTTSAFDQGNSGKTTATTALSSSGITPTRANSLLLILTGIAGNIRVSGYAVATTNPSTWTELYDAGDATDSLAAAYASRDVLTATGNATATAASSATAFVHVLNILPPPITTVSMTMSAMNPVIPLFLTNTISMAMTALTPTFLTVASTWTNTTKAVTTWINTTKL
jgi:hypothetical protein